jgi:hypothetical protein
MKISKERKVLLKAMPLLNRMKNEAKKEAMNERIQELLRGKGFFERFKMLIK